MIRPREQILLVLKFTEAFFECECVRKFLARMFDRLKIDDGNGRMFGKRLDRRVEAVE